MFKNDTVAVKCPGCGTMVTDSVLRSDLEEGKAVVACHICGRQIPLAPSLPPEQLLVQEKETILRMKEIFLKRLRWRAWVLLALWIACSLLLLFALSWHSFFAILLPGLPFIFFIFFQYIKVIIEGVQGRLGVVRSAPRGIGLSEAKAVKVRSIDEEYRFIASQRCPRCHGELQTGKHGISFSLADEKRIERKKKPRLKKMYDQIDASCPQCRIHAVFFFDIDQIDYVQSMRYTQEMVLYHMQAVANRSKGI
jgi:hypothetical protein